MPCRSGDEDSLVDDEDEEAGGAVIHRRGLKKVAGGAAGAAGRRRQQPCKTLYARFFFWVWLSACRCLVELSRHTGTPISTDTLYSAHGCCINETKPWCVSHRWWWRW